MLCSVCKTTKLVCSWISTGLSHFAIDFRNKGTHGHPSINHQQSCFWRTNYIDTPIFYTAFVTGGCVQERGVDEKGHRGPLSYPGRMPSIFPIKRGRRCHPSRRDGMKDVLLKQLIIAHLHARTCNLYPSNLHLHCLLWHFAFKLVFSDSQTREGGFRVVWEGLVLGV